MSANYKLLTHSLIHPLVLNEWVKVYKYLKMSIDIFAPDRRSKHRIRQPYDNNYLLSNSYSNSMNNCNNSGVSFIAITKRNTIEVKGRRKEERMEIAK